MRIDEHNLDSLRKIVRDKTTSPMRAGMYWKFSLFRMSTTRTKEREFCHFIPTMIWRRSFTAIFGEEWMSLQGAAEKEGIFRNAR